MAIKLYFDRESGCLVGINLGRDPLPEEIVVDYEGSFPPYGYTYRLDIATGEVMVVDSDECATSSGRPITEGDHVVSLVSLGRSIKVPSRGAFGVPFDTIDDKYGLVKGITNGVPVIGKGRYHLFIQVTYAVVRHFSIISRDLILTINGKEYLRNSISVYTRGQMTQSLGPFYVELDEEENFVGIISEPTIIRYGVRTYRPPIYPVMIIGGRKYTMMSVEKL